MKKLLTIAAYAASHFIAAYAASLSIAAYAVSVSFGVAFAQSAVPANLPPPSADLRDLEGVWNPHRDAGPPSSQPLGALGRDARGAGIAQATGSTLECTPIQRLSGAGGGMSNLWIEGPDEIIMLSEEDQDVRKFYLRAHHPAHVVPQPNGNSIAHWQGNTLVVDTIGYAKPDGSDLGEHTIERFYRRADQLIDDVTIAYGGKTSHVTYRADWRPDLRVWENVCEEGYQRYQLVNGQVDSPDQPPGENGP